MISGNVKLSTLYMDRQAPALSRPIFSSLALCFTFLSSLDTKRARLEDQLPFPSSVQLGMGEMI